MTEQAIWFYISEAESKGPVSAEQLATLLREGKISSSTQVWREGSSGWAAFSEALPELGAAPPPLPVGLKTRNSGSTRTSENSWADFMPHPWRRYWARLLDTMVFGSLLFLVLVVIISATNPDAGATFTAFSQKPESRFAISFLVIGLATIGNAVIIGLSGTSPGKWIFGIKVLGADGKPPGISRALGRELQVWLQGWGLGIPLVSLFTLIGSYQKLTSTGTTGWDKELNFRIIQRPNDLKQVLLIIVGLVALFGVVVALNYPPT